jgi:hypothetical protein
MTKPLDKAVSAAAHSADSSEDEPVADRLAPANGDGELVVLDAETIAAINEGREQARRGEFASDAEMATFFCRHRR